MRGGAAVRSLATGEPVVCRHDKLDAHILCRWQRHEKQNRRTRETTIYVEKMPES